MLWNKKMKTNCQIMARCEYNQDTQSISFINYSKYYEKRR